METGEYTDAIQTAFDAVSVTTITADYKLPAFKLVLESMLLQFSNITAPGARRADRTQNPTVTASGWTDAIADMLAITPGQVESIYYYDEKAKALRLVINKNKLPKSLSGATQHIAALVAAGRQAMKLDDGATDYEVIRQTAKDYKVFNSSNFTAYIKALGPRFMISGSGQNQSIQLTLPAYAIAAEFAKLYVEAD